MSEAKEIMIPLPPETMVRGQKAWGVIACLGFPENCQHWHLVLINKQGKPYADCAANRNPLDVVGCKRGWKIIGEDLEDQTIEVLKSKAELLTNAPPYIFELLSKHWNISPEELKTGVSYNEHERKIDKTEPEQSGSELGSTGEPEPEQSGSELGSTAEIGENSEFSEKAEPLAQSRSGHSELGSGDSGSGDEPEPEQSGSDEPQCAFVRNRV